MNHKFFLTCMLITGWSILSIHCKILILDDSTKVRIRCAAFSHDDRLVATGSTGPGTVKIWDIIAKKLLITINNTENNADSPSGVVSLAFDPNYRVLTVLWGEGISKIYILESDTQDEWTEDDILTNHITKIPSFWCLNSIAFRKISNQRSTQCIGYNNMSINFPEIKDGISFIGYAPINSFRFSSSGKLMLITYKNTVSIFELKENQKPSHNLTRLDFPLEIDGEPPTEHRTIYADVNKNDDKFLVVSTDGTIKIGKVGNNGSWLLDINESAVAAQFHPVDDTLLLVASNDDNIAKLMRLDYANKSYEVIQYRRKMHTSELTSIQFNHQGSKFITTSLDGKAIVWEFVHPD